jgi:hypothetical protein
LRRMGKRRAESMNNTCVLALSRKKSESQSLLKTGNKEGAILSLRSGDTIHSGGGCQLSLLIWAVRILSLDDADPGFAQP